MNVSIIAIAKNEGPYLSEWIFHHLYMGFEKIYIGINKTTDNSKKIIDQINLTHPNKINLFNVDWAHRTRNDMQPAAYSFMLDQITPSFKEGDFFCFIDVDEYWFTPGMKIKISDYLQDKRFKHADMISFPWAFQNSDSAEFLPPFKNKEIFFGGRANNKGIANLVKSFISASSIKKIKKIRPHSCDLEEGSIHLFHDGSEFIPHCGSSSTSPTTLDYDLGYFLHRIKRSEREYLAMLFNSTFKGELIKSSAKKALHRECYSSNMNEIVLADNFSEYFEFLCKKMDQEHLLLQEIGIARTQKLQTIKNPLNIGDDVILMNLSGFLIKTYGTFLFNEVILRISDHNFKWDINSEKKVTEVEKCLEFLGKRDFGNNLRPLIKKMKGSLPKN